MLSPGTERVLFSDHKRYRWCFRSEVATMYAGSVLEIAALRSLTRLKLSGYSVRCGHQHRDVLDPAAASCLAHAA